MTGAASGIGRATCERLAREGYRVVVADRDELGARGLADLIDGLAIGVDVADETSVEALFARIREELHTLDALVTCAGVVDQTPFLSLDVATMRRIYEVNAIGTFLCIREAARTMRAGGRICTLASIPGKHGGSLLGTAAYAASQGAILALTRSAARALADVGIAVNGVAPGPVNTPMIAEALADPIRRGALVAGTLRGRAAEAHEIAASIAWLLSPDAAFVSGEILSLDGASV